MALCMHKATKRNQNIPLCIHKLTQWRQNTPLCTHKTQKQGKMPFRQLPQTDDERLKALQTSKEKAESTDPAQWAIAAETKTRLDDIYARFSKETGERGEALAAQAPASKKEDTAMDRAEKLMSHFWQVFNLAIDRDKYEEGDRAYYQAPVGSKEIPWGQTEAEIVLWGKRLIDGEAKRIAAGGTAMTNPGIDEVKTAYDAFMVEHNAQSAAKDKHDKEQEDVEDMRPGVDDFVRNDLWAEIEHHFRREEPPSLRRKAREWGVIYRSRPGEEPEEGILPPETPVE